MSEVSEAGSCGSGAMHANPITVLYIGGEGRSGSTVLSTILGGYEGLVAVGEFRNIWEALKANELCGCGAPVAHCEFWAAVLERAFGPHAIDVDAMLAADARFARHRSVPRYLIPRFLGETKALRAYRAVLRQLYEAVGDVSRCGIIVDSTKRASYAYLLRGISGIDLRVVHLVRDSRAVAYSNTKPRVERPEVAHTPTAKQPYMPSQSAWRTAIEWQIKNLLFYKLVPASKQRLVKYERLTKDPDSELAGILQLASAEPDRHSSWDADAQSFESVPHHTLGGNPVRFKRGRVRLEIDDEWKARMNRGQKFVVGVITFPSLVLYGYLTPTIKEALSGNGQRKTYSRTRRREG